MRRLRVLIADDHPIVREGLRTLLAEEADVEVVAEAGNGQQALELARQAKPDVVLMDIVMPRADGIAALRQIRAANEAIQVIVLTSFADDQHVRDALAAGAIGYLLKDVLKADLLKAIRDAAQGIPSLHGEAQRHLLRRVRGDAEPDPFATLTPRERQVLERIAEGKNNRTIAAELHLTEGTVKGYVSLVLQKLGLADRTQAALLAVNRGLARSSRSGF